MPRQLKKVIFLPESKVVFQEFSEVEEQYIELLNQKKYYPLVRQIANPIQWKEGNGNRYKWFSLKFQGNIWPGLEYLRQLGYAVILYRDYENDEDPDCYRQLVKHGFPIKILFYGITGDLYDAIIEEDDINLHNSIFVATDVKPLWQLVERITPIEIGLYPEFVAKKPLGPYLFFHSAHYPTNISLPQEAIFVDDLSRNLGFLTSDYNLLRSNIRATFLIDKVVYVEDEEDEIVRHFIEENLEWIQSKAAEKGCHFVYFSSLSESAIITNFVIEYTNYHYPDSSSSRVSTFLNLCPNIQLSDWSHILLEILNLPEFRMPALIRNRGSISSGSAYDYSIFSIASEEPLRDQFEAYFDGLQPANYDNSCLLTIPDYCEGSADDEFKNKGNKLADDVIHKIDYLKNNGMYSLLAEIALRIFENNEEEVLKQIRLAKVPIKIIPNIEPVLSRLRIKWINKFDLQITLPDYGNLVVEMPRLPKALFYFFVQHPEGILLNSIAEYKDEIYSIYARISNLSDKNEIRRNIERLVDPTDNSINVNLSRIKSAFVLLIDDNLAKNYYITGHRISPKKIELAPDLIEIIE